MDENYSINIAMPLQNYCVSHSNSFDNAIEYVHTEPFEIIYHLIKHI